MRGARWIAFAASLALGAAAQAAPRLATYLTDANETRFVALFDDVAIELADCAGGDAARAVLGLASDVPEVQGTLNGLTTDFSLGTHPFLPCTETSLAEQSWAADAPVWADLLEGSSYFLAAPDDPTAVYEIPDRCEVIKNALNLRARVQQDGVLQGLFAPEDRVVVAVLDCGDAAPGSTDPAPDPNPVAEAGLALHTLPVFLTADSLGDTVYVLKTIAADGSTVVLPVWRMDGIGAPDLVMPGDAGRMREQALKALVGIAPDAPVTALGAADVLAVSQALFVDICTQDCADYDHQHGYFAFPGADLDLTFEGVSADSAGIDLLGGAWRGLAFGQSGRIELAGCDALAQALGIPAPSETLWSELAEDALSDASSAQRLSCAVEAGAGVCLRILPEGSPLLATHLMRGADCSQARHLILELPLVIEAGGPLQLDASEFAQITLRPAFGIESARLRIRAETAQNTSPCILSRPSRLIEIRGGGVVRFERLEIEPSQAEVPRNTIGIDQHLGRLSLDRVSLGGGADGILSTGLLSCAGAVYASGLIVNAGQTGALLVDTQMLMSAALSGTRRARLASGMIGLSMISGAEARLDRTDVVAPSALSLRSSELIGTRVALDGPPVATPTGDALRLSQDASVRLLTSTVRAFRCVGLFLADTARAVLILPGNAPEDGNTQVSCGSGRVTVI